MDPNLNDVRRHVAALPDEVLLEVNREDLTAGARAIYEEEAARRGLNWPAEEAAVEPGPLKLGEGGLVSLGKYDTVEEARFARDLLRNEQIPAWLAGELALKRHDADPMAALELFTQTDFQEQAEMLLNAEISEEELARQAEEAGNPDA